MKEKEIKKEVKSLAKQKEFEQIYQQYGPKYFRKYVSRKFKKEDLRKLKKEGKYLDIYEKYGEKELDYLYIYYKDIENEVGRKINLPMKTLCYLGKNYLKSATKGGVRGMAITMSSFLLTTGVKGDIKMLENSKKYAKEIDEYTNKVKEYSKKFNIHTQSDMEIIMRVMKDMHETIRGYGEPEIDAIGYLGMDVMDEEGIGVCRNMAANIADKLNAINPEYNARTIGLYKKEGDFESAKIEHNIIEGNIRTNIQGNEKQIYKDGQLLTRTIDQGDTIITYQYNKGTELSKKIIQHEKPKEMEEIFYDEDRNIVKGIKTIKEIKGNCEKEKQFINGKLSNVIEKTEDYYMEIDYDDKGKIANKTIANQEGETTTFYKNNGKIDFITIIKDEHKTTISYNEQGEEIKNIKEKTDQNNIFLLTNMLKKQEKSGEEIWPNHTMVAVDVKKDKATLIIDPTEIGLGVYKDGEIIMFNETQLSEAIYDKKILHIQYTGIKELIQYPIDYIKSFMESPLSIEELEEKYGIEAQNKMLEQIKREDKEKGTDAKAFRQNYKVDKGVTYNFDTNTVTIEPSDIKIDEENQKGH